MVSPGIKDHDDPPTDTTHSPKGTLELVDKPVSVFGLIFAML